MRSLLRSPDVPPIAARVGPTMHVNLFALAALLGLAVGFDLHTRRIPNCLVGVGILAGFSFSVGVWWSGTVSPPWPAC
jgi:hypothetical protein